MAMKEFSPGERLFAADLNDNFDETQKAGNVTSGTFADARIPNLGAGKITSGTFAGARIPNLNASKITAGRFNRARMPAGSVLQVIQSIKTNTFSTSSGSFTTVTGLSATITPSATTSRVLIIAQVPISMAAVGELGAFLRLTGGNSSNFIGNADGSRTRAAAWFGRNSVDIALTRSIGTPVIVFLDNPQSTSARTYSVQIRRGSQSGAVFVNRSGEDSNNANNGRVAASITVIEVAG